MPVMASEMQRRKAEGGRRNRAQIVVDRRGAPSYRLASGRAPSPRWSVRPAFTLVEMLVVITIIGILVALGTVAIFKALEAAKRARIKVEITNLTNAIESYKLKYGDYPPSYFDVSDPNCVATIQRHMQHCFPRSNWDTEKNFFPNGGRMTPAQALVFWLTSISKDPARPLSAPTTDRMVFFDFDKTRLVSGIPNQVGGWTVTNNIPAYVPQFYVDQSGKNSPFVYMEARGYFGHAIQTPGSSQILVPNCYPYLLEPWDLNQNGKIDPGTTGPPQQDVQADGSGNWQPSSYQKICANPKSFQIISAGLDGSFGGQGLQTSGKNNGRNITVYYKSFPTGLGYDTTGGDDDNLTNFSEGALGDAKP
jgi:prepilin-type N-terminal cleavage/methylation domain-containing protein